MNCVEHNGQTEEGEDDQSFDDRVRQPVVNKPEHKCSGQGGENGVDNPDILNDEG